MPRLRDPLELGRGRSPLRRALRALFLVAFTAIAFAAALGILVLATAN